MSRQADLVPNLLVKLLFNTASPAIQHAIKNAVGADVRTLPMTPEKVFMAMDEKYKV